MPDLLGKLLGPAAKHRGLAEARLLTDWATVIGPDIAKQCQPIKLTRDGLLHMHVAGSAALELQHSELQVVERINTFFGRPTVVRLRLHQAPPRRRSLAKRPPPPLPALSDQEKQSIAASVEEVTDDNLRQALTSLGSTLRQRKRGRRI